MRKQPKKYPKPTIFLNYVWHNTLQVLTNDVEICYNMEKRYERRHPVEEEFENEDLPEESEQTSENEASDKSISSDLIRGHINTIILRSLYDGDKYGYEIIAEIERKSHGQYSLKQPSLYSALKRLEREGYITSYWGGSVAGGRRKYFSLTDAGKEISERNQSEWEYSRTVIDSLISDKDFDFANPAPTAVDMRVLKRSTSRVPSREGKEEADEDYDFVEKVPEADSGELALRLAAFEEERKRLEEDIRLREEALRLGEEERARRDEELRVREEQLKAEEEERSRMLAENGEKTRAEEEERARAEAARIEELLKAQKEEMQTRYEQELAEQEQRIREEDEQLFRQRTQQIIHQNYINLVNTPPVSEVQEIESAYYSPAPEQPKEPAPETTQYREQDRGYRTVIRKLYANTMQTEPQEAPPAAPTAPPQPAPVEKAEPEPQRPEPKLVGRMDFDDLETRAARDGIRISTSGERTSKEREPSSDSLVHKGKALFFSSIVVFLFCIAVGSVSLGFQKSLGLPVFYPYFIWGTGLALLLIMGLAYVNRYGEHSLRYTGNILINTVVSYALCVILILIIALAAQIEFSNVGQLVTFIILPAVYFFGIIVFGLAYYLQIRPKKDNE